MRKHAGFLVTALLAVAATALVWFGLPHERELTSLWELLAKLVPFVFAVEAIARLDPELARRLRAPLWAPPLTFLIVFAFFVPKIFFSTGTTFEELYYWVLVMVPFIILSLVLSFRLGGGRPGASRRLGYGMLLLMLSGIEDLAFLTINPHTDPRFTSIPEVWSWATHMTVRLGHPATKYEAFAFIGTHVLAAALVFFLPGRALAALVPRGRGRAARGSAQAAPADRASS